MNRPEATGADLGHRLRSLRREGQLTIEELARASGVPASTISKIENGRLNPSLVHSINLATALGANLGFLVDGGRRRSEPFAVVRAASRGQLAYPEMALTLQDLSGSFAPGVLEARIGIIQPGAHSGEEPMSHPGEELAHVLSGRLRYAIDREVLELGPGDTLHFKCTDPHRWENPNTGITTVLWVFSDGLSF